MTQNLSASYRSARCTWRFIPHVLILLLTFTSLAVLQINRPQFLPVTLITCLVAAFTGFLSVTLQPGHIRAGYRIGFWLRLLHWCAFMVAVYIDLLMLQYGMASATNTGLFALLLLAAALFFSGLPDQFPLALCGVAVAMMVVCSISLSSYFFITAVPAAIMMGCIIFFVLHKKAVSQQVIE